MRKQPTIDLLNDYLKTHHKALALALEQFGNYFETFKSNQVAKYINTKPYSLTTIQVANQNKQYLTINLTSQIEQMSQHEGIFVKKVFYNLRILKSSNFKISYKITSTDEFKASQFFEAMWEIDIYNFLNNLLFKTVCKTLDEHSKEIKQTYGLSKYEFIKTFYNINSNASVTRLLKDELNLRVNVPSAFKSLRILYMFYVTLNVDITCNILQNFMHILRDYKFLTTSNENSLLYNSVIECQNFLRDFSKLPLI